MSRRIAPIKARARRSTDVDAPAETVAPPATKASALSTELVVGPADDRMEREADRLADVVMRRLGPAPASPRPPAVARSTTAPTPGAIGLAGGALDADTSAGIRARLGAGQPLPSPLRRQVEAGLGADLGSARVHTDPSADRFARNMSAQAFTVGSDVFFRQGAYRPDDAAGQRLLAHELAHVAQDSAGAQRSVVRRAVGFEFEVGMWEVEKLIGPLTPQQANGTTPLADTDVDKTAPKKGEVLVDGGGFELQVDESGAHRHLEFVTKGAGFEESSSGRKALAATMQSMTQLANSLVAMHGTAPAKRGAGRAIAVRDLPGNQATDRVILPRATMQAEPQSTAGIRLDMLPTLLEEHLRQRGQHEDAQAYDQEIAPGRSMLFGKSTTDRDILQQSPAAARAGLTRWQGNAATPGAAGMGSEDLVGMLCVLFTYITIGGKPLTNYVKVMAPLMARTNFAGMFKLLPQPEQAWFRANPGEFEALVLEASGVPGIGGQSVWRGGLSRLENKTPQQEATIVAALQSLTLSEWLRGIPGGRDLLTSKQFPIIKKEQLDVAGELQGLGSLGEKTDTVGTTHAFSKDTRTEAPVFELRRMGGAVHHQMWAPLALDVFDYIVKLNDKSDKTFKPKNTVAARNG
jgi:hypothetical protein